MGIAGHNGHRLQILTVRMGAALVRRRSTTQILVNPAFYMQLMLYRLNRFAITLGVLFVVLGFAATFSIALPYLFDSNRYFDFFGDRDPAGDRIWLAILHILPAIIALLIGPVQLSGNVRKFAPRLHVVTGRVYVFSVLASASGALAITPFSFGGMGNAMGFGLLAIA